jgi:hypothetical protein
LPSRLSGLPASHPSSPDYRADQGNALPGRPAEPGRGWEQPAVEGQNERPGPDRVRLAEDRQRHILVGDATGGGHRHGTARPGATEFPASWGDDTISAVAVDIARSPDKAELQRNGRWKAQGERGGVDVVVIVRPDGLIWTAYPLPGGPGVAHNPRRP